MTTSPRFIVGDRVFVAPFNMPGTVVEVSAPQTVEVFEMGRPGEIRTLYGYEIEMDNGVTRGVVDRDRHLAPYDG